VLAFRSATVEELLAVAELRTFPTVSTGISAMCVISIAVGDDDEDSSIYGRENCLQGGGAVLGVAEKVQGEG